ncbi:MAG TPA: hypothetical protein VFP44_02940 [Usitatibacter sp.]|nr:hypothetical protein [Usitatibacter sp.]
MDYEATNAALEYYDTVSEPAFDAIRGNGGSSLDMSGYDSARRVAADRVRAAYLKDTGHFNSPENVELMSVERIRRAVGGTILGKMLGLLP